ncbi:hypothetical protein IC582_029334 [Cucumis melo]
MSAQDTTPGHLLSTNALAFLMLSNASGLRPLLSTASFSAATLLPGFVDIRIDPSQPCHFQELSQNPGNDADVWLEFLSQSRKCVGATYKMEENKTKQRWPDIYTIFYHHNQFLIYVCNFFPL